MVLKKVIIGVFLVSAVLHCSIAGKKFHGHHPKGSEIGSPTDASKISDNSPALASFVSTFTNDVHSSKTLSDLFDLSQTPTAAFRESLNSYIYNDGKRFHISDPSLTAKIATQYITDDLDLTVPTLTKVYANTMGKFLLARGFLNPSNALSLAHSYATKMEESAKKSVEPDSPESKFKAIPDGFVNFATSIGVFTAENIPDLARYIGNEFKLAKDRSSEKDSDKPQNTQPSSSTPQDTKSSSTAKDSFIAEFMKEVQSSPTLQNLFDISGTSVKDFQDGIKEQASNVAKELNFGDPDFLAKVATQPISGSFDSVPPDVLTKLYAISIANYLEEQNALTSSNAKDLAASYATSMEGSANYNVKPDQPKSKFKALSDGFLDFANCVGSLDAKKVSDLAYFFGNQVTQLGKCE